MAASNPNQMEAAQAQVQEVVGVMRNNIDKVVYHICWFERKKTCILEGKSVPQTILNQQI